MRMHQLPVACLQVKDCTGEEECELALTVNQRTGKNTSMRPCADEKKQTDGQRCWIFLQFQPYRTAILTHFQCWTARAAAADEKMTPVSLRLGADVTGYGFIRDIIMQPISAVGSACKLERILGTSCLECTSLSCMHKTQLTDGRYYFDGDSICSVNDTEIIIYESDLSIFNIL